MLAAPSPVMRDTIPCCGFGIALAAGFRGSRSPAYIPGSWTPCDGNLCSFVDPEPVVFRPS